MRFWRVICMDSGRDPQWNRKDGHIAAGVALMLIALSPGGDIGPEHEALWVVLATVMFVGGGFLVFLGYRGTTKPPG